MACTVVTDCARPVALQPLQVRLAADNPASPPDRMLPMPALSPIASVSLSGMRAAQAGLDTAGHNIANLATPDFRRQQLLSSTQPSGGVQTSFTQATRPGSSIEADMVDQLVAKNAFLANLAVFKTGDQLLGSLLDIRR